EARKQGSDLQDMLLVDDQAVSLLEDRLQFGERVDDLYLAVFALHVLVYQSTLERPRPEQCDGGRDVLEAGRTHVLEQASKPGRLQLEHAVGVGRLKQPERGRVVPGDLGQVESKPPGQLQVPDRVLDDRQVSQAQEIHLQESYLLYGIHLVLSHHCPLFLSVLLATG